MNIKKENQAKKVKPAQYAIDLINCAIIIQSSYLSTNKGRLRHLQEEDEKQTLSTLFEEAHNLFVDNIYDMETDYMNYLDTTGAIFYQAWKNNEAGLKNYADKSLQFGFTEIDLAKCENIESKYVNFESSFNSTILSLHSNSIKTYYFSSIDQDKNEFDISTCDEYGIGFYIKNIPNETKFRTYIKNGIDIYNPNDPVFTESCFISKNYEFDMTQKYRRTQVFDNKTFAAEGCDYYILNQVNNKVYFNCSDSMPNNYSIINYSFEQNGTDFDKIEDLAIKCAGKIDNYFSNYAFWLFSILLLALLVFDIVFGILTKTTGINDKYLENEQDENDNNDNEKNNVDTEQKNLKDNSSKSVSPREIDISLKTKSFSEIFKSNLKELHPILSLFYNSFVTPILFTSWIFVFNILTIFGFIAIYLTENQIEERIYSTDRRKFYYSISKEYLQIIYSIATSIGFTLIIRSISLVTYLQKEEVIKKYIKTKDKSKVVQDFAKSMLVRRIILGIFMLALTVFLFYYSTVFCGIYIHTQSGWFYSGIWSLLILWLVLNNLYIFIITIIEKRGCLKCSYYMKRLYPF